MTLTVIDTHPVQYRAPVYRALRDRFGVPLNVVYGSDFSIAGYFDREFRSSFSWDNNLVREDDACIFLSRSGNGGAADFDSVSARGLGTYLERLAPSAVLLTGYSGRFYTGALARVLQRRVPVLFRAETTDHALARSRWRNGLRAGILRRLYRRFARLLFIGERSLAHYRGLAVPDEKLFFSPYCVDTAHFQAGEPAREKLRATIREEFGVGPHELLVLFSGKLSRRKGPHILISAIRELPEEIRRNLVAVFLGDGAERPALEAAAAVAPRVAARFLGFRNQTELSPCYHAADLFVLPSRESETWGLVVNEALHHGVPCVVSDAVGCAPDLIEPGVTGEIARAGCASSLAEAIQRALPLARSAAVRERCRAKVSAYTVEKAAEGIARAYFSLNLEQRGRVA